MTKKTSYNQEDISSPRRTHHAEAERPVKDTKQPDPTNHPTRKTDPSSDSFAHDEEE